MNNTRILYIFTRTPLHVGAGASVGAIDQPVQRERHTGFPIIPASSLKGTFADAWNDGLLEESDTNGKTRKVRVKKDGTASNAAWLFGSDSDKNAASGALQFTEARLLAFPIRSARGSFAWITCPLMLQRAARDGELKLEGLNSEPQDDQAFFTKGKLDIGEKIVLEEYTFTKADNCPEEIAKAFQALLPDDPVWKELGSRLVILSNGMMSFFAISACEVAQHVRIDDETGTAAGGALFNQENVPSESLFYSVITAMKGRKSFESNTPEIALTKFGEKIEENGGVFQFGGDASTGLGFCTVQFERN